ncbi:MAG: NAD(P)/FAD-dependent oxidoreductase, partial [Hyphomicrobiales bacterium]
MERPHVLIIGAGFGGLEAAKKLANRPVRVTIVDANNYHLFTPLLYQVASSLLNPSDIARPVRSIFGKKRNIRFRQAKVESIDLERRAVRMSDGAELDYDYLVIAAGSTTNYFGNEAIEERALGLKDLPEAMELRNHILRCLEIASLPSVTDKAPWLTFLVVGGGPTGVEYAGALSELVRQVLPNEYPELANETIRILLVEGVDEVLPPFPRDLGHEAHRELERKGVEVRTGVRVSGLSGEAATLSDGTVIPAHTLVWAAGVRPNDLAAGLNVPRSRSGRIEVDEFLRVRGQERVFAIGDIASFEQDGREVPMLSAPAMQQGRRAARNILHAAASEPLEPFRYRDKGSMATIGKNAAVAAIGRFHLTGFIGWVTWLLVHLYYIIGFRNRIAVLMSWGWNYIRSDRPVRIIARAQDRDLAEFSISSAEPKTPVPGARDGGQGRT